MEFHYRMNVVLCIKVVQILFKEKLRELSGNAQRSLFQVIGRMIDMGLFEREREKKPREFFSHSFIDRSFEF